MEWKRLDVRGKRFFTATVSETEQRQVAFVELFRKMCIEAIPHYEFIEPAFLKAEIWPDSGRIIVFPAIDISRRDEPGGCELVLPALHAWWENLADSELADDAFTDAVGRELRIIADDLIAAFRVSPGQTRACQWVVPGGRLCLRCFSSGDTASLAETEIIVDARGGV